jgi:hypothetical protein
MSIFYAAFETTFSRNQRAFLTQQGSNTHPTQLVCYKTCARSNYLLFRTTGDPITSSHHVKDFDQSFALNCIKKMASLCLPVLKLATLFVIRPFVTCVSRKL